MKESGIIARLRAKALIMVLVFSLVTAATVSGALAADENAVAVPAATALQKLDDGNKRFVKERMTHTDQSAARRQEIATGQHPFAVILACSDSRVAPEVIFDQGLGDLFVVRVAGNIADESVLASIEYAVEHLNTGMVMVLGHKRCGAVISAVSGFENTEHSSYLNDSIKPAVLVAKKQQGDLVDNAVKANVEVVVDQLSHAEPSLTPFIANGKLKIVGAYYDLDTGTVSLLQ